MIYIDQVSNCFLINSLTSGFQSLPYKITNITSLNSKIMTILNNTLYKTFNPIFTLKYTPCIVMETLIKLFFHYMRIGVLFHSKCVMLNRG